MAKCLLRFFPVLALAACVTTTDQPQVQRNLAAALNAQPDGYQGVVPQTGEHFSIVSTSASSKKLCRVVSFEKPGTFRVDTFCKAKGGPWT